METTLRGAFTVRQSITRTLCSKEEVRLLGEGAHGTELFVTLLNEDMCRNLLEFRELGAERSAQGTGHGQMVVMGSTLRLGNDFINQAETSKILRGDFQGGRRLRGMVLIAPKNGGT